VRDFISTAFAEVWPKIKFEGEGVNEKGILAAVDAEKYKIVSGINFSPENIALP
jgi:GDP-D-mannose dehydratase